MWQRFTEQARRVMLFALEEATLLGADSVSTEHLLLGILRDEGFVAYRLLADLGVPAEAVRQELGRCVARGKGRDGQDLQLTSQGKKVIDFAYDELQRLGEKYIGTEHLLLGLIREEEGLAGRVLGQRGVKLEPARVWLANPG